MRTPTAVNTGTPRLWVARPKTCGYLGYFCGKPCGSVFDAGPVSTDLLDLSTATEAGLGGVSNLIEHRVGLQSQGVGMGAATGRHKPQVADQRNQADIRLYLRSVTADAPMVTLYPLWSQSPPSTRLPTRFSTILQQNLGMTDPRPQIIHKAWGKHRSRAKREHRAPPRKATPDV